MIAAQSLANICESMLLCVPPHMIEAVWPAVAPLIDQAYAEMDDTTPDVKTWLQEGKGLLWVEMRGKELLAAMTTSLVPMRSGLACRMVACGGGALDAWKHHHAIIERYAEAEGCCKVICDGRLGWSRVLEGYLPRSVSLVKELSRGQG
jgi:hypothetical protein